MIIFGRPEAEEKYEERVLKKEGKYGKIDRDEVAKYIRNKFEVEPDETANSDRLRYMVDVSDSEKYVKIAEGVEITFGLIAMFTGLKCDEIPMLHVFV